MRRLRLVGLAGICAAGLLAALPVSAAAVQNPFAGLWNTTLSQGVTGTVTFKVIAGSAGASDLTAMGGKPCAQPTVYYHGDYTDTAPDTGTMVACTSGPDQLEGRYHNDNAQLTYPGGGFSITLGVSGTVFSGFFTADDPSFAGEQFPYDGSFVKHVDGDGCCPAPTGGPGPSTAPTASAPFGTPVTIPYSLGAVIKAPSPTLPAGTSEVDLSEQISDAEVDRLAAVLKVALDAYNRRREIEALKYFCVIYTDTINGEAPLQQFGKTSSKCDDIVAGYFKKKAQGRTLAVSASHCGATVIPMWKPGTRPTAQQNALALAAARNEVRTSCTAAAGRLSLKAVAVGKATLNQVLGKSVQAGVGARGKASGTPELTVTWAPPRTRGAPPPTGAKAKPGHYTGKDSANNPISFDVTADSANVTNLSMAGHVTCTDGSGWTWTLSSSSMNPISSSLAFSRTYSGGLTASDSSISNINVTYSMNGTLTRSGSASGTFQISHISWDQSGAHYDCTGTAASWTATVSG